MSKRFKPVIKHDVVTQTYTIRDEKGIVIQVPDVIIDNLDSRYKAERDTLIDDLPWYKAKASRLERENEDLKFTKKMHLGYIKYFSNNNELLRDEVKSLKQENTQLKESRDWDYEYIVKVNEENKRLEDENEQLKKENEMIDEQFTDYIDETCGYLKLLSEFSQHIGNKPSSSTYKYFRAKLDGIGIKEDE